MNLEDQILCLCTRQNFGDEHQRRLLALCDGQAIDWALLFETAEAHHVSPLVNANLEKLGADPLGIPENVRKQFKTAYIHNVLLAKGTQRALKRVLTLFAEAGVNVMLVKGAAYNVKVYDQPWYMISGDVDLIIKAQQESFRTGENWHVIEQIDSMNNRRNKFQAFIEYDFFMHHDISMNGLLAVDAAQLWERAYKIRLLDHDVLILPPEELLLTAAINSCRKRFVRLKSLCDIASIAEKYPDLDWDYVLKTAKAWQAHTILYTALAITQKSIGCSVPSSFMTSLAVHPLRQQLIHFLINILFLRPLDSIATSFGPKLFGRKFSWSLLLTYATYPSGLLIRKAHEVWLAWRHPYPEIPAPVDTERQVKLS